MTTMEQRREALQSEYWSLMGELQLLRQRIKDEWTTASVQTMRHIDERIGEIDLRIKAIKKLKSWSSDISANDQ